jgi:hypothetical protein
MYGAILGDIIGSPYEFDAGEKTKEFPLFSEKYVWMDYVSGNGFAASGRNPTTASAMVAPCGYPLWLGCMTIWNRYVEQPG